MESVQIQINPPPEDRSCEVCGRPPEQLKPFGGAGDPLVGDFKGALLVKTFRALAPEPTKAERKKAVTKFLNEHPDWDEGSATESLYQFSNSIGASWECRDCIVLSERAWWKKKLGAARVDSSQSTSNR